MIMLIAVPIPSSTLVGRLNTKYKYMLNWNIFMFYPPSILLYYSTFMKNNYRVIQQTLNGFNLKTIFKNSK